MSNPITWTALKQIGIIPAETQLIAGSIDPTLIQLTPTNDTALALEFKQDALLENKQITRKEVKFS
jgi:hypothetical protein